MKVFLTAACAMETDCDTPTVCCVLTSQLLLLYYLLHHEHLRLSLSSQCRQYSPSLFSQLPIRYLLSKAQKNHHLYGGELLLITTT